MRRCRRRSLSVTSYDVARVAKDDVHPDQLVVVAVETQKIEPGLKQPNLAPIGYSDASGNVISGNR